MDLWTPLRDAPDRSGVFTDFDGTLSPVVVDAAAARPEPGAGEVLRDLADRYARVAVVSGRPVAFLGEHLGGGAGDSVALYGNYGVEWMAGGRRGTDAKALRWRGVVATTAAEAERVAPPGVVVERKGVSVAVHVRPAPQHAGWAEEWATARAAATGLALHPGKMAWELRAPVAVDKGTVVAGLCAGLAAACFFGDDLGDLAAFDALDSAVEAGGFVARKVAVASPESPRELLDRADLVVPGPAEVVTTLRSLLAP